jgi:Uma2 family endonuclease
VTIKTNRIVRYYDTHEVEGEELSQSWEHFAAIEYLLAVLNWLFYGRKVGIGSNINLYQTDKPKEKPKSPDVMVIDDLVIEELDQDSTASYYVGEDGPPPRVAFEISSNETWKIDLDEKPTKYAAIGIAEYFVFDPNVPGLWKGEWQEYGRLLGWRKQSDNDQYQEIPKDKAGRLWSEQLESWLVVEGKLLRLYTADGQLRLTKDEAEQRRADAERQLRLAAEYQSETERQRTHAAEQWANAERQLRLIAEHQAEAERQRAEAERQRAENLAELLRRYNVDPDNLT